ncbi:MAG TPA: disulfide bond formation protein B [Burkholderiaceae bacterium]|jgi:disulfide bond formation protein DsbB|nr:disulfide bond formation protein B [Burkholderiaceae bacterium]
MIASPRTAYTTLAGVALGLIGVGLLLQHVVGLDPCPLCIFQRIAYLALALFALIAAAVSPRQAGRWFGVLALISALAGAGIAGRHVWLQMNPQSMSCGPGLAAMLDNFPLTDVLPKVFRGSGDCSESAWTLVGLTIADWSLIWFVILSAATIYILFARRFRPPY